MSRATTAHLALGSNVGDRMSYLRQAVRLLSSTPGILVRRVAPVYETEPVGVADQPWFLNTVVEISTNLSPPALLSAAKKVEDQIGRTPTYRWGPREIDVDLLLYGEERWDSPDLTIPHPRMSERLFVLLPLRDLKPDWSDARGIGINQLVEKLRGSAEIRPYPEGIDAR